MRYMVLMYSDPDGTRVLDFHVTAVEVRAIHDSFGMGEDVARVAG